MLDINWSNSFGTYIDSENQFYFAFERMYLFTENMLEVFLQSKDNNIKADINEFTKNKGRPFGSQTHNDDTTLGFMHAIITREGITPNKAATLAIEHFGRKGASDDADNRRLREKYSLKFRNGD